MKRTRYLIGTLAVALLVFGCANPLRSSDGSGSNASGGSSATRGTGSVTITISEGLIPQTVVPDAAPVVDGYVVEGTDPSGAAFGPQPFTPGSTVPDLEIGEWSFTVEAQNAAGVALARGSATVTVTEGANTVDVSLSFLQEGTGSIELSVSWPSSAGVDSVEASLDGAAATDISDGTTTATYSDTGVSSGSHILTLELREGSSLRATVVEAMHVYDNQTTTGSISLGEGNISTPPAVPGDPTVSVDENGNLLVEWDGSSVLTETGYLIERDTTSSFDAPQELAAGASAVSYTDDTVTEGQAYHYRLAAENDFGRSGWTASASETVRVPDTTPPAEVDSLNTIAGDGEVTLTWSNPTDSDFDGVEITWDPNGSTVQIVDPGTESFTASALTNGTPYEFTVRTVDTEDNASSGRLVTETPEPLAQIAFNTNRHGFNQDIYIMNADGTSKTRLTSDIAQDDQPALSPDGSKVAFISDRGDRDSIYVINSDGTGLTQLTGDDATDYDPEWSSDGTEIIYTSTRASAGDTSTGGDVWVMNADGSAQTQITITPSGTSFTRYYNPSLSPDGTQIAFHRGHYNGNGLQYDIWVMDADGTNQTRVTNDMAIDEQPDWSPDGTQLAFRKEADIYTIEPDGTGLTQVTSTGDNSQPHWSSDGTQFAITSFRDNNSDIWLIDIDGSNPQQLTTNGATDRMPSW